MDTHQDIIAPGHNRLTAAEADEGQWIATGLRLSRTAQSAMFAVGDWWNSVPEGVDRVAIVRSEEWLRAGGLTHGACRVAGSIASRWPALSRDNTISFHHYRAVTDKRITTEKALALLATARTQDLSVAELRTLVARDLRSFRAAEIEAASTLCPLSSLGRRYPVLLADPPWKFQLWSDGGMRKAAQMHYPCMETVDIAALPVADIAAKDAILFLWATAAMFPEALTVLPAWNFEYKTFACWVKPNVSCGFWFRNQHEPLIIATRGNMPPPAQIRSSVFDDPPAERRHSSKPESVRDWIAQAYPKVGKIELFARTAAPGWAVWGNEVITAEAAE